MHVLYFYQYFGTRKSAYSTRVYEFTKRWVDAGDKVTVITSVYDRSDLKPTKLIEKFDVDGIDVRMINIRLSNKHGFVVRLLTFFAFAIISCWYALTMRADILVASSGPITVGFPGLVFRYLRRRPFIFEVRDLWPEGAIQLGVVKNRLIIWMAKKFERLCYHAATRIVTCSEGQATWIRQHYGAEHVDVIPHGSDNELVSSLDEKWELPAWAAGKHLVLYTGALGLIDDCKQILDVADVFRQRDLPNVEFVVIGDGKERAELEAGMRQRQLEHIHFLGYLPKTEVMQWLRHARCSLFLVKDVPFLATASPNKLYDAFAAGVPVVQATDGWIKDLFDNEHCGTTVPANDPEAMADAVARLIEDDEHYELQAGNSKRVGNDLFDRSMLAHRMHGILSDAIGRA